VSADARYVRDLQCGERRVQVLIRRTRRKQMAIHVFADRPVELRVPRACPWYEIEAFLQSRRDWILQALVSLAGHRIPRMPSFTEGEQHGFMGQDLSLRLLAGKTRHVGIAGDRIIVRCDDPDDAPKVQSTLEGFYRKEAKRLFPDRLKAGGQRFPEALPPHRLVIRKMRTRWGSCSHHGDICLNLMLIQRPLAAIDFVVTHELCHLMHFAHDKSFYALMDKVLPDWQAREKLLTSGDLAPQLDLF
jgi:predicted metal-dependent hydrolase